MPIAISVNTRLKEFKQNQEIEGSQILNKKLLSIYKTEKFSINNVWNDLIEKKELYGFETINDFYHLTDLKTFKKLQDL